MSKPSQTKEDRQDAAAPPVAALSLPDHTLDQLRMAIEDDVPYGERIERVSAELRVKDSRNKLPNVASCCNSSRCLKL